MMQFELLPNEIFLDVFDYFDYVDLFRAFHGLNSRFNTLLHKLYQSHHLDFRRISKQDFDIACQQYLPSIADRVLSLRLSDSEVTPGLPSLFLSRGLTLTQFRHVRSLTLNGLENSSTASLLDEIPQLKQLISLTIIHCAIPREETSSSYFWNQIWTLPKLQSLKLESFHDFDIDLSKLTTISSALHNLSIQTLNARRFNDVIRLFQQTLHLRTLSMKIRCENINEVSPMAFLSIATLKLVFCGKPQMLNNLFHNMPNLSCLIIDMQDSYLTGHQCKQILLDNLPKIKIFRFQMHIPLFSVADKQKQVDEVLDTFRTPFWLDEHQWFVRCDWDPDYGPISSLFYTLPYAFGTFTGISNGRSSWTSPDDTREHWLFDHVQCVMCQISTKEQLNLYPIRFPKIQTLVISVPVNQQIWYIIPTFRYLTSLRIFTYGDEIEHDLQIILNHAPILYELFVADPSESDLMRLSRLESSSIRRLHFYVSDRDYAPAYSLDDEDCMTLAESSLGRQCESFSGVHVESPPNIIYLMTTMTNLRVLNIVCKLEKFEKVSPTSTELIDWLLNHLPTKCFIPRCRLSRDCASIALWVG